ncbi:MAG: hypothetical protein KF850_16860 [Labilithrix sp.]|nr:hypothetical protein [Labilithrix sp.]MBX3213712.1 hypothetical protein [Labilithrix sp.]
MLDGCGGGSELAIRDAGADSSPNASFDPAIEGPDAAAPSYESSDCKPWSSEIVESPPPGAPAEPSELCAAPAATVSSNLATRVTLANFSRATSEALGFVAVPTALEGAIVGMPTIAVTEATTQELYALTASEMTKVEGGYRFRATWPKPLYRTGSIDMLVTATLSIACNDGGTKTIESVIKMALCETASARHEWVSSGDVCLMCTAPH